MFFQVPCLSHINLSYRKPFPHLFSKAQVEIYLPWSLPQVLWKELFNFLCCYWYTFHSDNYMVIILFSPTPHPGQSAYTIQGWLDALRFSLRTLFLPQYEWMNDQRVTCHYEVYVLLKYDHLARDKNCRNCKSSKAERPNQTLFKQKDSLPIPQIMPAVPWILNWEETFDVKSCTERAALVTWLYFTFPSATP